MLLRESFSF